MWHGRAERDRVEVYRLFLIERAIPDYQSVDGNPGVRILERHEDDSTRFISMTSWESLDAIKAFAGDDVEKAKYYPEDDGFLLEFEPSVVYYDVVGRS